RTGIDAMVNSLDPYTNYISENDIESYRLQTEGRYNGIGAVSKLIDDYVTLTEVYKDQSADKAGLKAGDQIVGVAGKDTKGKTPQEVNDLLKVSSRQGLELTIRRPGQEKDMFVAIERATVEIPNVPFYDVLDGDIGYVVLTTFTRQAGANVGNAVKELKKKNPNLKGVILDLRGNGGGLLAEAVNVSNVFIPQNELVTSTQGKVREWDRNFKTQNQPIDIDLPLAVTINGRSASASEIVCGTMQDYDRGILIGQQSYGKGLVQNTKDIGYNAKLKLTIAKYYIPSGRCIQSVEYADGEPVNISDEERTKFKTENGRVVLDGGGVRPDIVIPKATDSDIIKSIVDQDYIFKFVTQFCLENETIAAVEDFRFTKFDEFVQFLENQDFKFETQSEKLLKKLEADAKDQGYTFLQEIETIKANIAKEKEESIMKYKKDLIKIVEKEIAGRYYYQEGKIKMGLRNDDEIQEAIAVLRDTDKYNEILGNK
ncbi:MAG: S41 family peptidase, partial [Bacteroidota bacterium]